MTEINSKKILFIVPHPIGMSPGQRFRFEQYLEILNDAGYAYEVRAFLDNKTANILYDEKKYLYKIVGIVSGYLRRFYHLIRCFCCDYIYIYREASPLGPPFLEWIIAKLFKKKIIYDFDDAIWIPKVSPNNAIVGIAKCPSKVSKICKWAYKVSCGNEYLRQYALKHNKNAYYIPTTIDTENLHNRLKHQNTKRLIVGWTGTHSTLIYLEKIIPLLSVLSEKYDFEVHLICNQKPKWYFKKMKFIPWNIKTEIDDLLEFNIGLMPLIEDEWTNGKCGFKALQYMALGIPPLVSPVGVNKLIVQNDVTGYLCESDMEWENYLVKLLYDPQKRIEIGMNARKFVENNFSVKSNKDNFLRLFT
ncbi:MAG: glycosyltransferase [Cytophagaceae bacterium]|nr:glycosyltransferase [Cytophagaceae bacterium]MDW8455790.1 glycosyltransferase [Cytophagaceae bacterium]